MATIDTLRAMVEPIIDGLDAQIYDLEYTGGVVRVTIDRPGGVDLDTIAEATRQISRQIDLDDPIPARFTLEVTSPGLERRLRLADHWTSAVGEEVRVKMDSGFDGERRIEGTVTAADGTSATLAVDGEPVTIPLARVDVARTIFRWGPQPKPGGSKPAGSKPGGSKSAGSKADGSKSGGVTSTSERPRAAVGGARSADAQSGRSERSDDLHESESS